VLHGEEIAGVFEVDPDQVDSPVWLMSVSVPDADGVADRAMVLGGSLVTGPADLPDRGRYAVIEDPQGAFFVLLHASSGDPPDDRPIDAGQWLWTELWTTDAAGAVVFYSDLIGYRSEDLAGRLADDPASPEAETSDAPAVFIGLYTGEKIRAGVNQLSGDAPPSWLPYVAVRDPDAVVERAVELGARVLLPPDAVRNREAAILIDPAGAPFGVQQWPRPQRGER
jgi:predicted enzyme related to lactoylglutathione lyase